MVKFKPKSTRRPMDSEELQRHLHIQYKGASKTKNGKAYQRRPKHVKGQKIW